VAAGGYLKNVGGFGQHHHITFALCLREGPATVTVADPSSPVAVHLAGDDTPLRLREGPIADIAITALDAASDLANADEHHHGMPTPAASPRSSGAAGTAAEGVEIARSAIHAAIPADHPPTYESDLPIIQTITGVTLNPDGFLATTANDLADAHAHAEPSTVLPPPLYSKNDPMGPPGYSPESNTIELPNIAPTATAPASPTPPRRRPVIDNGPLDIELITRLAIEDARKARKAQEEAQAKLPRRPPITRAQIVRR